MRAQGTLPGVRLAHQAVSGKQPLCQLWRHTSSCRRAIRTIFLIVLNYATRRGVIEHPIQRVRSKRSTRERLPRPCYHVRGFPITGFTMESYTLSLMVWCTASFRTLSLSLVLYYYWFCCSKTGLLSVAAGYGSMPGVALDAGRAYYPLAGCYLQRLCMLGALSLR